LREDWDKWDNDFSQPVKGLREEWDKRDNDFSQPLKRFEGGMGQVGQRF